MGKKWTIEEEDKIIELWGETSIKKLSKSLMRTERAIITRAKELGLTLRQVKEQVDGISVSELAKLLGVTLAKVNNWIAKHGLPLREWSVSSKVTTKYINLDDFWKWAENHQEQLYTKLFDKHALGAEPKWMEGKRKLDLDKWTTFDTEVLKELNEDKVNLKEIAYYFSCSVAEVKSEVNYIEKSTNLMSK
ncbi:hypothetical protein [Planococcus koreensis]|uniref:hypothetical protein n=1 Tax=Planococcus koreensis TaxID=112331 RepID=UPI0039FDC118